MSAPNNNNNDNNNPNYQRRRPRQQTTIEEDVPEYRSVMIGSSSTMTAPPLPSRPFSSMMKPSKQFPKPLRLASSSPASSPSKSTAARRHQWTLQELKEVPSDYTLVRTNVYIKNRNPQEVADLICDTLQVLSITPIVDKSNEDTDEEPLFEGEENILLAETQYGVKFAIRLFESSEKNPNNNDQKMIVVEIKRTFGCSLEFRDAAKSILRAIKTDDNRNNNNDQKKKKGPPSSFAIPSFLPKRSQEDRTKSIEEDVRIACRMISSNKTDEQILGLESMERLTTIAKNKNINDDDIIAARSVLGHCDCLCRLLLDDNDTTATKTNDSNGIEDSNPSSSSSLLLVRRKVLTILANSLEAVSSAKDEVTDDADGNMDRIQSRSFLVLLLSCLQRDDEDDASSSACLLPNDAYQAVRCLRYLLRKEVVATVLIEEMNATDILSNFCRRLDDEFTPHHHTADLQRESNQLLTELVAKK